MEPIDRLRALEDCARRGLTKAQACAELGAEQAEFYPAARFLGVRFKAARARAGEGRKYVKTGIRRGPKDRNAERDREIARLFVEGRTTGELEKFFGISRARIQQILSRQHLTSLDGGYSVVRRREQEAHAIAKQAYEEAKKRALLTTAPNPLKRQMADAG